MVVYPTKHRVDVKILLDVIDPWSRVDRNIPVILWEKVYVCAVADAEAEQGGQCPPWPRVKIFVLVIVVYTW